MTILSGIVRAGVSLVLVERDGELDWRIPSEAGSIRTLTLGTDNLAAIRRFWKGGRYRSASSWWPVLQTVVEWDTATATYAFKRINLGFFNKRVWLFHEQRETDETGGTFGIEIKKEW